MVRSMILMALLFFLAVGCAGKATQMDMRDESGGVKTVHFPKGTVLGGASKEQAAALAQTSVDSHNMVMRKLDEIKTFEIRSQESQEALLAAARRAGETLQRLEGSAQRMEESNRKIVDLSQENLEATQKALLTIEQLSKKQGTGEVTLFFPTGSSRIVKDSREYERLVQFLDYLSRESRGRKVLFVSIGSASAFGKKKLNEKLAKRRAEAPREVIDRYLVHIPHEFFKVYGIGDAHSPRNVPMKEHEKYQHVRLIAFYDAGELPGLPEGAALK